jgi:predicted MFS family arabinose efflux permease
VSPGESKDSLIITALWLMMFSASAQVIIIAPILPEIGEALDTPVALLGWLATSYTVLLAVMAIVVGPISDKFGRRRILLAGCATMAVVLYLHGFVTSFTSMLVVRALAGVAGGMLSGAAVAFVGDYFPYTRRGWANGWIMSGMAVGQILGIPIGKVLASSFGFRWSFLMFAITMTFATILVWFFVPQPEVERDESRLTFASVGRNYLKLIQQKAIVAAASVYFLMFLSIGVYVFYLPLWLENVIGISKLQTASLFFVGGLANVVAGPLAGRVSDVVGRKPLIVTSCVGMGLVMVATTYVISNVWYAYLIFGVAMIMVALRMSPLQSLMTALVTGARRGMLMSLAISAGQLGMSLGTSVAGTVYTRFGYASNTIIGAVAVFGTALLVHRALPEPYEENDE